VILQGHPFYVYVITYDAIICTPRISLQIGLQLQNISFAANRGGIPEDKDNFVLLVKDLRTAFDKHKFLLTAAIGAAASTIDTAYDIPK